MAIAFVNFADGGNNGGTTSSLSFSYNNATSAANGGLLLLGITGDTISGGVDNLNTPTYGGVNGTLWKKNTTDGNANRFTYVYAWLGAATGSQTFSISCGTNHFLLAGVVEYSGVAQSGQPDATSSNATANTSTDTGSVTTVADNAWVALLENGFNSDDSKPGAGTGSTLRVGDGQFGAWGLFDHNAAVHPAGSVSMTTTRAASSGDGITQILVSFSPQSGFTAKFRKTLSGIGGKIGQRQLQG